LHLYTGDGYVGGMGTIGVLRPLGDLFEGGTYLP